MKWTGPAQWMKREARAGHRLPFDRHIDDATIRLRDGAVMRTLHIGGMEFETQDADQLDHAQAVREVLLRSVLDARFVPLFVVAAIGLALVGVAFSTLLARRQRSLTRPA